METKSIKGVLNFCKSVRAKFSAVLYNIIEMFYKQNVGKKRG